tara:strand:+ start:4637 stop:6658 length:2022 start_codon:yes stop_codon:yes gene_type:complete
VLKNLWLVSCLLVFNNLQANYIYESNQSLIDLTNQTNTVNLNSGDDSLSPAFDLDFTFTFYENDYTSARMATNGCLHFGLGTGNINYNNYCGDYTPDPLPQYDNTLYPFWTDLIRDNDSKMLAKSFSDKAVFGWYDMREYNRSGSDNSLEVILWTNNTYEFRYGNLDVIQHDVLIGEQGSSSQLYTYYFHDECNTGSTNTTTCYNYDWNDSDKNQNLESGGSLYSEGYIDCSDPLNNSSCNGYAAAYLNQQCDIDQLYSETCPSYWEAYDDLQCDIDPQYAPFCAGYQQEASVAYYVEQDFDYGYEEDFSYEEPQEEIIIFDYEEVFIEFIPQEVYVEEVNVLPEINTIEETITEPFQEPVVMLTYNDFTPETSVVNPVEELIQLYEFETIIREELEQEVQTESIEVIETIEEIEEVIEVVENDEEIIEEIEEEIEELVAEETSTKGGITSTMLNVVRNTISVASASSSNTSTANSTNNTNNNTASSSSGISTSNSPSMSDQITSANAQNNMVLSLNTNTDDVGGSQTQSVSTIITPLATLDSSPQVVMAEVQVQNMQGEISTAVSGVMTQSEADQIADQIIANNIKEQQEELQEESQETGEYADQSTLVAYLGYVPAFEVYKGYEMPKQDNWYTPRDIYADAVINDNNEAFYGLSSASLNTLNKMVELQPNL